MSSGRTIKKIRRAAVEQLVREGVPPMGAKASFDAILVEVERKAAEKAFDEGWESAIHGFDLPDCGGPRFETDPSPYRKEQNED